MNLLRKSASDPKYSQPGFSTVRQHIAFLIAIENKNETRMTLMHEGKGTFATV